MDYYSLFWGPGVISTVNEPRGAFKCGSSTIIVLADSSSFLALLLCFGSRCDFHMIDEHRGAFMCRSSTLAVLADSGPFHGHSLFCVPGVIFMVNKPRGAFTCRS